MRGKIIKGIAGFYYVHVPDCGTYECKAKGIFRKEQIKPLYLGGAPWIIKSYTQKHITIIQNEISPDKEKVATIELEKID